MVIQSWIYDAIIYIYALSLLFYFSDFALQNRRSKRMGTGLLVFVWLLQTVYLVFRIIELRPTAFYSMYDSLFYFSWLLVGFSLVFNFIYRIDILVFFVNIIGFAVLALSFFSNEAVYPILEEGNLNDEWLIIHISMSIGSYAAFTIAALCSGLYLFLHRKLKEKKWSQTVSRLPSLEKIEAFAFRSIIVGVPLLILSLTLGLVSLTILDQLELFLDVKVFNSFLILGIYIYYIYTRVKGRMTGYKLAQISLWGYVIVIVNYIFSNFFSGFHQWIWAVNL